MALPGSAQLRAPRGRLGPQAPVASPGNLGLLVLIAILGALLIYLVTRVRRIESQIVHLERQAQQQLSDEDVHTAVAQLLSHAPRPPERRPVSIPIPVEVSAAGGPEFESLFPFPTGGVVISGGPPPRSAPPGTIEEVPEQGLEAHSHEKDEEEEEEECPGGVCPLPQAIDVSAGEETEPTGRGARRRPRRKRDDAVDK